MDQVALPLVLAYQLRRNDRATGLKHVKPAADLFFVKVLTPDRIAGKRNQVTTGYYRGPDRRPGLRSENRRNQSRPDLRQRLSQNCLDDWEKMLNADGDQGPGWR